MADYYVDNDAYTGTLTGTLTFTNGSSTVTGSGTSFTTELSVGDYIKSDDATEGKEWYKVTAINSDTELTIDHNFQQGTHSATAKYNSNDGSESNPWSSPRKLFEELSAGDVGHLKKGQTYIVSAELSPTNDGNDDNPIKIVGDWGEGSKPIIEFDTSVDDSRRLNLYADQWWHFENFKIYRAYIYCNRCPIIFFKNVDADLTSNISGTALQIYNATIKVDGGSFLGNLWPSGAVSIEDSFIEFENAEFGSYGSNQYAFAITFCAVGKVINCKTSDSHQGSADIFLRYFRDGNYVIFKNYGFKTTNKVSFGDPAGNGYMFFEDYENKGNHCFFTRESKICKNTSIYTGNAQSSVEVTPRYTLGANQFIYLPCFEWKLTDVSASQHTATVKVRGESWTNFPTSDELYIEVEYYDQASGSHTARAKSTNTLSANDTWTDFQVTFTPAQSGDIYIRGYLRKYESGAKVYFNGEVTIS